MNVDLYRKLFVHRADVFAQQNEKGNYAPVGEGHWDTARKRFVYDSYTPLDDTHIDEHLAGFASYGVYVIDPAEHEVEYEPGKVTDSVQSVKYAVFDLDTYDADALDFLTRAVERLVLTVSPAHPVLPPTAYRCLMLEDSGGKGYHIWLFFSEPIAAARVRAWTDTIRAQYVRMANTVAPGSDKWPPLEIFPKQDSVAEGSFGNLVKLPFGVHAKSKAQALALRRPGWATAIEDVVPFPVSLIPEVHPRADRTQAPERSERGRAPFACIAKLLDEGAPDGCRDKAMYHLAAYLFTHGLDEDVALDQCLRTNESFDPPLTEQQVRTKVRSAYGRQYPAGCGDDWLRDFCPGGEHCYAPWNERPGKTTSVEDASYPASMTPEERRAWRQRNEEGGTDAG